MKRVRADPRGASAAHEAPHSAPQQNADRDSPASAVDPVLQLQRTAGNRAVEAMRSTIAARGRPLDPSTRMLMEERFGRDLSSVRVHTDAAAAESAKALGAQAYTVGQQVVFGDGLLAPQTTDGRALLAHELAHTIQQRDPSGPVPSNDPAGSHETSARDAARSVAAGQPAPAAFPSTGVGVSMNAVPERELAIMEAEAELDRMQKEETEEAEQEKYEQQMRDRPRTPTTLSLLANDPRFEASQVTDDMIKEPLADYRQREKDEAAQHAQSDADEEAGRRARFSVIRVELEQHGHRREQMRDMLSELPPRDRAILRAHGMEWPVWPTKGEDAQENIISALDGWAQENNESLFDEEQARETARLLNLYRNWTRGLPHVVGSLIGGGSAYVASKFTDDPKVIADWAELGDNVGNVLSTTGQAIGNRNTYSPKVEDPITAYGRWRYTGKAPIKNADVVAKPALSMPRFTDVTGGKRFLNDPRNAERWAKVEPESNSFEDVSMQLKLEPPGTTRYRSTAQAAKAAKTLNLKTPGRLGFQSHATASSVRGAFKISGNWYQSAHVVPQAVYRALRAADPAATVSEGRAFTTLLPIPAHRAFDSSWVAQWTAAKDAGRAITAGDVYDWVSAAVNNVDPRVMSNDAKGAINDRLRSELFSELGLTKDRVIVPARP